MEKSYYKETAQNYEGYTVSPALQTEAESDVCIIGGGFAGLSAAVELRNRGFSVILLESETVGFGASGRNGGQAIVDVGCGIDALAALTGWDVAKQIFSLTAEGLRVIRSNVKNFSLDCDMADGTITIAQRKKHDAELISLHRIFQDLGHETTLWDKKETQDQVASKLYTSALYDKNGLHIHPLKYCKGMAVQAKSMGAGIFENTKALFYDDTGSVSKDRITVHTAEGKVTCKHLLLAANVYNTVNPFLMKHIIPVGTYIAATKSLGKQWARRLIPSNAGICDMNLVIDYYRFSADYRLLFGGRVSYTDSDPRDLKKSLFARMTRVFPEFTDYTPNEIFEYAWGGKVDITMNRAPHFGKLKKQIYFLQGFSGHGVALSNIAGRLVAEAIDGEGGRFRLFENIPHRKFLGGKSIRGPLVALAMLYYRMKDLLP